MYFSNYICLCIFFGFFCCGFLVLFHYDLINYKKFIKFSYICQGLLYVTKYDLFWRMFLGLLRRIHILQVCNGIFCKCLLSLIWSTVPFKTHFFVNFLSIDNIGLLKSHAIIVLASIWAFMSVVFVLWNWACWHSVHICLQFLYPLNGSFPLSIWSDLLVNFGLKSVLLDMSTAIPAAF
jgi:hypothetical protein